LEFSTEMTADLAGLDAWVYPRSLRTYQLWLVEGRPFQVMVEGFAYGCRGCQAGASGNVLRLQRLDDGQWFELRSGPCGRGHALAGQGLIPVQTPLIAWPDGPALVRVGHANFAHFLWNELDAVLRLLARDRSLLVVQDHDTVLDLGTLIGVEKLTAMALEEHSSVRVGSMLVSRQARDLVVASLRDEQPGHPVARARAAAEPLQCLVLGVRGPGRRELVNEEDFYIRLIGAIREQHGSIRILLDGFTYQRNQELENRRIKREVLCTERVQRIIQACGSSHLECLSGLPFSSWLERVSAADFYITHEGTMQHKIGWLLPTIPGLCLIGPDTAPAIVRWHLLQCEQAASLSCLPVGTTAMEPWDEGQHRTERDRGFRIVAIDSAIDAILTTLAGLAHRGST
jgi:hypothetical protein